MPHTLCYTPGSGNSFKPALVARQTGQALTMRKIDMLACMARVSAAPGHLAIDRLLPA